MIDAFDLRVSAADVDDLRDRVRRTRWAPAWPVEGWLAGTDHETLRRLADRWANDFDWDARQREIDALPWRSVLLDGTPLSYLRFDAERPGRIPIVLTNGWPSSALELVDDAVGGDRLVRRRSEKLDSAATHVGEIRELAGGEFAQRPNPMGFSGALCPPRSAAIAS